ncbi:MAG: hypothetical protein ACD_79C00788G0001, partial [uncultured bacterium]
MAIDGNETTSNDLYSKTQSRQTISNNFVMRDGLRYDLDGSEVINVKTDDKNNIFEKLTYNYRFQVQETLEG